MIEYIEKFDQYLLKCGVREDPSVTLSRFRNGLQPYIKRELFMREVTTLEHAYQIARDGEKFFRFPKSAPPRPVESRTMGSKPNFPPLAKGPTPSTNIPMRSNPPPPMTPPTKISTSQEEESSKKIIVSGTPNSGSRQQCFRCHGFGHFATQCPSRGLPSLLIDEEQSPLQEESEKTTEVYEASYNWEDEYDTQHYEWNQENPLGVIRCILAHVKEEDWRRTSIFHTFIKIGKHVRKVILDSGSCVNAISPDTVKLLGLNITPHPNSYKVS